MDPLTHALLGASLGYAGFGRRLGRTAAGVGALAAFAPDADVFIRSASDPLLAIEYHRHFTHALAFAPIGAAVTASFWLLRARWRSQRLELWTCALLAYLSHALLDAATSYGTQLLWPFSNHRSGFDVISIIDPPFTLWLGAGLWWSLRARRRTGVAVALALSAGYLALGTAQHERALAAQEQLAAARGHHRERFEAMPTMANNIVWRTLYVHGGKIYSDRLRVGWFSAPTVRAGWALPLVEFRDLTEAEKARSAPEQSFPRFNWFSEGWVARSPHDATLLADMRYSLSSEAFDPIWGIRFTPAGAPNTVEWVNRTPERKIALAELWREITGADERFQPLPPAPAPRATP
jgi:inner membrane protein